MHRYAIPFSLVAIVAFVGCGGREEGIDSASTASASTGIPLAVDFTGTENWDPFGAVGPAQGALVSPGVVTCPGDVPTGDPFQPCPPGSRIKGRGIIFQAPAVTTDSQFSGLVAVTIADEDYDANGSGRDRGTWHLCVGATRPDCSDETATWDGTFENSRTALPEGCSVLQPSSSPPCTSWTHDAKLVGSGTSGDVQGMQARFTLTITSFQPVPIFFFGQLAGQVFTPGAAAQGH